MAGAVTVLPTKARISPAGLGLKRYMEDFSNFTDRGTADLALWDWYMVYAAAFGISDRVMRELAKAYPQVNDPAWLDANASNSLFYWDLPPVGWYSHRHNGPFDHDAAGQMDPGISGPAPGLRRHIVCRRILRPRLAAELRTR